MAKKATKKTEAAATAPVAETAPVAAVETAPVAAAAPVRERLDMPAEAAAATEAKPLTVYDRLVIAVRSVKPQFELMAAKETDQHFFERLLRGMMDIPDPAFATLDEAVRKWSDTAVDDFKAKRPLAAPEGFAAPAAAEKKPRGAALVEYNAKKKADREAAIARGETPAKPAKPAKDRSEAAKPRERGVKNGGLTSGAILRYFIVQRPDATTEAIESYLKAIGREDIGRSTVSTFRVDACGVLDVLTKLGLYKKPDAATALVYPPGMSPK